MLLPGIIFLPKSRFSDSGQKPWTIIRCFDKISFALTFASGLLASDAHHSEFRGERVAEGNVSSEKGLSGGDYGSVEQRSSQSSSLQTLLVRFEIERDSVKLPFCRTCDDGEAGEGGRRGRVDGGAAGVVCVDEDYICLRSFYGRPSLRRIIGEKESAILRKKMTTMRSMSILLFVCLLLFVCCCLFFCMIC